MNVRAAMRRLIPLVLGLALGALVVLAPTATWARVGARPPAFTLPAVPGGPTHGRFDLGHELGHHPVVILFWATWCVPCRQELPVYEQLYQRYKGAGLRVVAIAMDGPQTISRAGGAARRLGIHFPVLSDVDTQVSSRLNPRRAAPFSIWIDKHGRIAREEEGFTMSDRATIARGVAHLVGQH